MIERVVRRHSWVAMQKLRRQRDYTFLFEARDGRLIYLKGYQPVATTPRLMPAIRFLEDIHLLDEDGPTPRALALLEAAAWSSLIAWAAALGSLSTAPSPPPSH